MMYRDTLLVSSVEWRLVWGMLGLDAWALLRVRIRYPNYGMIRRADKVYRMDTTSRCCSPTANPDSLSLQDQLTQFNTFI